VYTTSEVGVATGVVLVVVVLVVVVLVVVVDFLVVVFLVVVAVGVLFDAKVMKNKLNNYQNYRN
jgi:hypothetical protein